MFERRRALVLAAALPLCAAAVPAERLPLKTYTTAEGLPSDRIHCILADSHGYLWFGTSNGISRFDGYAFTNLGTSDGLPGPETTAVVESRDGTFWAATNRGLLHWDPAREAPGSLRGREVVHVGDGAADEVQALLEDPPSALWAATRAGLHRISRSGRGWRVERVAFGSRPSSSIVNALSRAPGGGLFVGTEEGLFRVRADGASEPVDGPRGPLGAVRSLLQEPGGPLWIGTLTDGMLRLAPDGGRRAWAAFRRENGLAGNHVTSMIRTEGGTIWASCFGGVSEISADRRSVRSYTSAEGLTGQGMWSLAEDAFGSVWIGSDDAGLMRLAPGGFRRFGTGDGLTSRRIGALFDGPRGEPCALTRGRRREELADDEGRIECFDGRRFRARSPRIPDGTPWGWGWQRLALVDAGGEWWVPTFAGLFRFPAVPFERLASARPLRRYTTRDGLPSDMIYRLFADSRGDLWLGLADVPTPLARWSRAEDRFDVIGAAALSSELPMSFAEDRSGAVWVGYLRGGLARVRGTELRVFGQADGVPPGSVRDLLVDRDGRLWAATSLGGLARLDRPDADPPRFAKISAAEGLASESVSSLGEDGSGRIYAGTERGLDRIDPARGSIEHFSSDDGLAPGVVECIHRDAAGHLWFGSVEGLSWLDPAPRVPSRPPPVRITRVVLDGVPQPVAELGGDRVVLPDPSREAAPLEIEFGGIDIRPGGRLRYQHRLEGIDREWSAPADRRSVVYARMPAGSYRFLARAVGNDGAVSESPAEVRFRVLPPIWRRPPLLALIAACAALLAYALHRMRLTRALEVERVRSRVARDLHDDVGAGLSEIAILSEVATHGNGGPPQSGALREIGESARRLVDSMSDIVWSTDPRQDDASSLVARIRHFAANTLENRRIGWSLEVAPQFESRPLDAETRRQILLIVKEALTNVARHSGCTRASVRIEAAGHEASIEIEDDGRGLAAADGNGSAGGHGLGNMRTRAESLGGSLRMESRPEAGTRIHVRVPLGRRPRRAPPPA